MDYVVRVTGCASCPFVGKNQDPNADETTAWVCTKNKTLFVPRSAVGHGSVANAVPAKCPLWEGAIRVELDHHLPVAYEGKD